jgi:hypothetical protein
MESVALRRIGRSGSEGYKQRVVRYAELGFIEFAGSLLPLLLAISIELVRMVPLD